jgi:ABC-type multidrug transport system ATPase subunit
MPADTVPALVLRSLTKSFGRPAVDRLDLTIAAGEFYALLGPNGAGKTTTLRLVAGLLPADDGDIRIFGVDARRFPIEAKRIVAWLPDEPMLYDKLDPLEYLEFVAGLGRSRRDEPSGWRRTCSKTLAFGRIAANAARDFRAGLGRSWRSPARLSMSRGS